MDRFSRPYFSLIRIYSIAWFKETDRRKILGLLWNFINPLIVTLVLYVIFRGSFGDNNSSFFVYLLIGSVVWNFFSTCTQSSVSLLLWRQDMVKNIVFPKEILVIAKNCSYLLQHIFEIAIIILVVFLFHNNFSWHVVFLPIVFLLEFALLLGISLIISTLGIYFRDFEYIWAAFLRIGFFLVPIFYQIQDMPPRIQNIIRINPISQIMIFYRNILLEHSTPNMLNLVPIAILSGVLIFAGVIIFIRRSKQIAERI
jgi:lipopolysaccharide transport system permease protein